MVHFMKVIGIMTRQTVMDNSFILMGNTMLAILLMIRLTVKELSTIEMEVN